jgi:hypothetical protein
VKEQLQDDRRLGRLRVVVSVETGRVCAETKARHMGRRTMVWEKDPSQLSGKESKKLDMCGKNIKSLATDLPKEGTNMLHSRLQTIYLRTNRITSLEALALPLHGLHILDVCFNELAGPQLKHLASAPNLYQLYLSGNNLKTLESLPVMNELEVLVASSCHLTSLHMPVRSPPPNTSLWFRIAAAEPHVNAANHCPFHELPNPPPTAAVSVAAAWTWC